MSARAGLAHALSTAADEIAATFGSSLGWDALPAFRVTFLAGIAFQRLAGLDTIIRVVRFTRRTARHTLDTAKEVALAILVRRAACLIERSFTYRFSGGTLADTVDAW